MSTSQVIAVDLDGTVTWTDTLHESILALIGNKPIFIFILPFWFLKGIAYLKSKVAEHCTLDVTTIPYNLLLIDWLKEQKAKGKKIVLCTAANERVAKAVAEHLGLFDDIIASNINTNLKSGSKRKSLEEKFGNKGYEYAGNSRADIKVWAGAANAIIVNASKVVQMKASKVAIVSQTFHSKRPNVSDWITALRLHQWLKNFLLFVPLLTALQFDNIQSLSTLVIAFVSFSLCASSVYITNDLLDLESDRNHPRKKLRPFASAKLPIALGVALVPFLAGASIWLARIVGGDFQVILVLYLLLTVVYSFLLKRLVLVDCLTLATLYTIRISAGAAAVSISISFWLLAFSVFIFLSLALVKRFAELVVQEQKGKNTVHGRGYLVSDASLLKTLGVSSGYISTLVIALYVHSDEVVSIYAQPKVIWLVLPIILFWISWVWLKAARGEMHDDPIIFAVKDKTSLLVAVFIAVVFLYAATGMIF